MGTINIGESEKKLISEIERLKAKHKIRIECAYLGLNLAIRQMPKEKDNLTQEIIKQLNRAAKCVENLGKVIQGIEFSQEYDEEKFQISWIEIYHDPTGSYYKRGYGENGPVTEKQFVFALEAWDREVCKRLTIVKELEGGSPFPSETICADIEGEIHKLLYAYV